LPILPNFTIRVSLIKKGERPEKEKRDYLVD